MNSAEANQCRFGLVCLCNCPSPFPPPASNIGGRVELAADHNVPRRQKKKKKHTKEQRPLTTIVFALRKTKQIDGAALRPHTIPLYMTHSTRHLMATPPPSSSVALELKVPSIIGCDDGLRIFAILRHRFTPTAESQPRKYRLPTRPEVERSSSSGAEPSPPSAYGRYGANDWIREAAACFSLRGGPSPQSSSSDHLNGRLLAFRRRRRPCSQGRVEYTSSDGATGGLEDLVD